MSPKHSPGYAEPQEEQYTTWHNPLPVEQKVAISLDGGLAKTLFRAPPGGTVRIPSRYDRIIHILHNDVVAGGLAPQLVKHDVPEEERSKLHFSLDTQKQEREALEEQTAAADLARQAAEKAQLIAAQRLAHADEKKAPKGKVAQG